ncbi:type II secretion system GspH family protein [Myxococcota bacterium]|nr:type II secretion system GspH family protein [Myxococcota bacterium]
MSLIELVVAIVVIAISLTGAFALVNATTRRSVDPMLERQATSIAEAYLEEILQQGYVDPDDGQVCPAAEANRALFDNVCDYAGLADSGARDQKGDPVTGLEGYRVQIAVARNATLGSLSGETVVLRIDVTVTDPLGRPVLLSAYRTNA